MNTPRPAERTVNTANKLFYGIGDFGFNMVINTLGSFMMYFGTTVSGVPSALMGLAIAIAMVWDAITDPIAGFISDRFRSVMFGRRHGFMLIGIIGLAVANALLWAMPEGMAYGWKFLWIICFIMLLRTFSTMYQTPAAALGVEISGNINERTQIQSIRAIFLIIAIIVPVVIMGVLEGQYGLDNPIIYQDMAYINGAVCLICGLIAVFGTYSYVPTLRSKAVIPEGGKFSIKGIFVSFAGALKDGNIRSIILGYTASLMSIVFLSSLMIHVLQFTFMVDNIFLLMGAVFVMTILSQPLWILISKRYDKKTALFSGLITAISGTCVLIAVFILRKPLIDSGAIQWVLLPVLSVMGAGAGAMYSMPLSMLGDTIAYNSGSIAGGEIGTYTGYTTLANKLSQSLTLLIIGIMLDVIGFQEGNTVSQPEGVQWGLGFILAIGILLSLTGGLLCYKQYNLKKEDILKKIGPKTKETRKEDF